jgi:DNA-binding transcriptional LysR family regulator
MDSLSRLQRIDLHSLRLFAAVAKEGSISRAADRCHIATSALSRRLADLEYAVGSPLFVRSRKGVLLTDAGRLALERADRVDEELRCLLLDTASRKHLQERVRLYASYSVVSGVLPDLLASFSPVGQRVRIDILEGNSTEVAAACVDGVADLGIGLEPRAPVSGSLESRALWADRLAVLLPTGHPLTSKAALKLEQVAAFPMVGSNPAGALHRLLQEQASARDLSLDIRVTACNFSAACRLAAAGLGLAIMPRSAIGPSSLPSAIQLRPLLEPWAERKVMIYAGRKQPRTAGATALLHHLCAAALRLSGPDASKLESRPRNLRDVIVPGTEPRPAALMAS